MRLYQRLMKETADLAAASELRPLIEKEESIVYTNSCHLLEDDASHFHITISSVILGAYSVLVEKTGNYQKALTLVQNAFYETLSVPINSITRVFMYFSKDPLETLKTHHVYAELFGKMYGSTFEFDSAELDNEAQLIIRKCFYHRIFTENGKPELLPVLCHYDNNWISTINKCSGTYEAGYHQRISDGADTCIYYFRRGKGS